MKLKDIDLRGYGRFSDEAAAFKCERFHLPLPWDYVYTNGQALLRVRHDGGGYLQIEPPGGPALLRQERGQSVPMMFAWIVPEPPLDLPLSKGEKTLAFSNFWQPTAPCVPAGAEPDEFSCTYAPEAARWRVRSQDWLVETELWVPPDAIGVVMTISVTNAGNAERACTVVPVVKPHLAPFSLAPWDVPHLYQTSAFCNLGEAVGFWMETRDPGGNPARRLRAVVLSDLTPEAFEVAGDRFIGKGTWASPEAIWQNKLALKTGTEAGPAGRVEYGTVSPENAVVGQPPLAALSKKLTLAPGAKAEFTVVFGKLPEQKDGKLPPKADVLKLAEFLKADVRRAALAQIKQHYADYFAQRTITTPDEAFNQYVNEFLQLQLDWVNLLDRGWPTGMRGTRDAAQDAAGSVPVIPELARSRLIDIFSLQRSDGWFLRQYSTAGKNGVHDRRDYVDAGCWVWELLRDYLVYSRDFKFLKQNLGWLDNEKTSTVLEHAIRLFEYYLTPRNIGQHGLCKIREGDWNDSVNRAGLEGKGESVMVSCQAVLGLEQCAELFEYLVEKGERKLAAQAKGFRGAAAKFRANLLKHAFNKEGYFNGVFTDAKQWVFSPKDPDGKARINGPVNSFAVIAGIVNGRQRDSVFDALNRLKGPHGWRLFHPGIGEPPIQKLGRLGQGDLAPGLAENGTPYNHGSQGFLGRACWSAGRGSMLREVLRFMFPYDQAAHPIDVAKTAPYGVVNHWKETIGLDGVGGDTFLSGSISTAVRNCYQGLIGFRPDLRHVVIDPCVPGDWKELSAELPFLKGRCTIKIANPDGVECGVKEVRLNGKLIAARVRDERLDREVSVIPFAEFKAGADHVLEVRMG